ncbi:glycosyltransferase family protein [Carboxylicivirga linearis]|uniref:Uncharacterized protein n=1 Tax=Carboxylicivirga linearis TaxID=1628157 RepID=A0ABS5K0Z3_9BACT|nr:hypothetical protein [Carboxylicivirga linearis]MBS2100778.1 hypothetical protein [Carboxylicivirga linearis]
MNQLQKLIDLHDDIMYLWFSGYLESLSFSQRDHISRIKVLNRFFRVGKLLVKDFRMIFYKRKSHLYSNNWLILETLNNYSALKFLKENENYSFVKIKYDIKDSIKDQNVAYFLPRWKLVFDMLFPLYLIIMLIFNDKRKAYWDCFDVYFQVIGLFQIFRISLKKASPGLLVFSNDHSMASRSLLMAAKSLGIKTAYIQHASVSQYFPPLKFDVALLEGKDAYEKYKAVGKIESKIQLVGMPKFDKYSGVINRNNKIESIGICYNIGDSIEEVSKLIDMLQSLNEGIKIKLRPHPADSRSVNIKYKIDVCDSKRVNSFEFLQQVDCIIVGNSSIILEAALLNVLPLYFKPIVKGKYDYYGFLKNNIAVSVSNNEELKSLLFQYKNNKPNVFDNTKYYNEIVGTEDYGFSSVLVKKTLNGFCQ